MSQKEVYDFIASSPIPCETTLIVDAFYDGYKGHRARVWSYLKWLRRKGKIKSTAVTGRKVRHAHTVNLWEAVR